MKIRYILALCAVATCMNSYGGDFVKRGFNYFYPAVPAPAASTAPIAPQEMPAPTAAPQSDFSFFKNMNIGRMWPQQNAAPISASAEIGSPPAGIPVDEASTIQLMRECASRISGGGISAASTIGGYVKSGGLWMLTNFQKLDPTYQLILLAAGGLTASIAGGALAYWAKKSLIGIPLEDYVLANFPQPPNVSAYFKPSGYWKWKERFDALKAQGYNLESFTQRFGQFLDKIFIFNFVGPRGAQKVLRVNSHGELQESS